MICFLKVSPASFDNRLKKYMDSCKYANIPYIAITWDRLMKGIQEENEISFKRYAPVGHGYRRKNFFSLMLWYVFAFRNLVKHRKEYEIIHACNFVTALIAFPVKLFLGKKLIFDIFDTSGKLKLEHFIIKHSDIFILPNEKRIEQLKLQKDKLKNFLEVENVPLYSFQNSIHRGLSSKETINLSYVGSFEKKIRGLENVLKLVLEDERFVLEIAGSGHNMDELIIDCMKKCNRIIYHGVVPHEKGMEIMKRSDFIVALYYTSAKAHKYASPNKIYESLYLSIPIITSKNTLVGNMVELFNSGYTIEDSYNSLVNLFSHLDQKFINEYHQKEDNAKKIWNEKYADYIKNHMLNYYIMRCKDIIKK